MLIGAMLAGFLLSLLSAVRKRAKEPKYQKLPAFSNDSPFQSAPSGTAMAMSYQHSRPNGAKDDRTYCVIDGRLVDSK